MSEQFTAQYIILLCSRNPTRARAFLLDPENNFDLVELFQMRNAARAFSKYQVVEILTEVIILKMNVYAN